MFAPPGLDTGLLVEAQHVISRPQCCTFPAAPVQVDDAAGLAGEVRVARENPTAMAPGTQGILAKPAPERGAADLGNDAARHRFLP
jgi:hypothetical protein